ncbi:MAG: Nucleoid occlusion protein [Candidatus Methanolliviera sp. GoM_oil]|nr:MAG: Nucleoid occlusion protein [Candidatus Methanolliviera sp. GoM_oil]
MEMKMIRVDAVSPNPLQPREAFDRERLKELANTIDEMGVLQPILVRPKEGRYEIIAGERRWKASQIAGKKEIPALIKDVPDGEVMIESLIENVHREDLKPVEQAKAILEVFEAASVSNPRLEINDNLPNNVLRTWDKLRGHRHKDTPLTEEEEIIDKTVKKIGLGHRPVYEALSILKLPKSIQIEATEKGTGKRQLARISAIKDKEDQERVFRRVADEKLSEEATSKLVKVVKKASEPVKKAVLEEKSKITPEIAEKIITVKKEEDQEKIIKKVKKEDLTIEGTEKLVEVIERSSEMVKKAVLKPESKITPEIAVRIKEFPEEEQQREIIKEIERSEDLREKGINAFIDDRLDITKGRREPEITIHNPHKRLVEDYERIYNDVTTMYANHVLDLPKGYREKAIGYMEASYRHLGRELEKLRGIKPIEA